MALLGIIDIIEEAYERVGVDPRAGNDYRSARRSLDIMLSDWANRGLNLWTISRVEYPVVAGQSQFTITATAFDIMDAVIRDTSVTPPFDITLDRMSPTDYLSIPFKTMPGRPTRYMVSRTTPPMTVTLWQVPDRNMTFIANELAMLPSVSNPSTPLAIPERFQSAMISGLAYQLALKRAPQRAQELRAYYEMDYEIAAAEDRDRSPFIHAPDIGRV